MAFCSWTGNLAISLPSGARWASPSIVATMFGGAILSPSRISEVDGKKVDLQLALNGTAVTIDADWIDSAGRHQNTKLSFAGPATGRVTDCSEHYAGSRAGTACNACIGNAGMRLS
jgi:hypothetical protein